MRWGRGCPATLAKLAQAGGLRGAPFPTSPRSFGGPWWPSTGQGLLGPFPPALESTHVLEEL